MSAQFNHIDTAIAWMNTPSVFGLQKDAETAGKIAEAARGELAAQREALLAALRYLEQQDRGTTHYEGCEDDHPRCKLAKQIREALRWSLVN